ncbi:putative GMC oxidoreductase [Cladorrhinum sp. PSN332]|nr:putative GMC oxidoreductase [Cladorrhinum sp. PSN332]
MGLYTTLPENITEVDVIIARGGTAGCIVAARLVEADPKLSILVIEGGSNNDAPEIAFPALCLANLMPGSKANIFYQTKPEEELSGRQVIVPCGGVLGGGSSTNLMMYSRAQRSEFDGWDVHGWSADDMVPFLKKIETFHNIDPTSVHGNDGPIQVSSGTFTSSRIQDQFISSAGKLGWPEIADLQALNGTTNVSRYLHPKLHGGQYSNLDVLVQNQVVKVLFEHKRAVGIEFAANALFQEEATQPSPSRTVKARKLVVLSCGAIGTPTVLERSGVGSSALLKQLSIPVISDLPGVGREYEDHQLSIYPYHSNLNPEETVDAIFDGRRDIGALIQKNDKILGWNTMDVTCKLRPSESDITALGPKFQQAWKRDFESVPDRPLGMIAPVAAYPGDPSTIPIPNQQYFSISTFSVYPYSRGHIHITSPTSLAPTNLDFVTGFFSDPDGIDIKTHLWLYKTQREIVRRMPIYRGEVASGHPPFPAHSKARCTQLGPEDHWPAPDEVESIQYSAEDDEIIEQWLRKNVGTTWHSLGTCKMVSLGEEERGNAVVVDANLSVYGVEGLKIADLSVVPRNVAANTCNTAMVVGEKAADIIRRELGL